MFISRKERKEFKSRLVNLWGQETENHQITTDLIHIGMLRLWLNEDRIKDHKKMVTNEQLLTWLKI